MSILRTTFPATGEHTDDHLIIHRRLNSIISAGDYASLGAAITAAGNNSQVYLPNGTYTCDGVDLTNKLDVTLVGQSLWGAIINLTNPLEIVASQQIRLNNLTIKGDPSMPPDVGILLARSNYNVFDQVFFTGKFNLGCLVNYSSECNIHRDVQMQPTALAGMQFGIYSADTNTWGMVSRYTAIGVLATNLYNAYESCVYVSTAPNAYPLWFGNRADQVTVCRGYLATPCGAYVRIEDDHFNFSIQDVICELAATNAVLLASGNTKALTLRNIGAGGISGDFLNYNPAWVDGLKIENCIDGSGTVINT